MKKIMKLKYILASALVVTFVACNDDVFENVGIDNFAPDQAGGYVSVSSSAATVTEGGSATITIDVPNPVGSDITVNFSLSGDATAGTDYTVTGATVNGGAGSGTIVFDIDEGGSDTFTFTLDFPFDATAESAETVTVTLTGATAANGTPIDLGDPTSNPGGDPVIATTVTVSDPDVEVAFTGSNVTANEGLALDTVDIPLGFDVSALAGGSANITYSITSLNGTLAAGVDYNVIRAASPITAATADTIQLEILPDQVADADTLRIIMSAVTPTAGFTASVGDADTVYVFFVDNLSTVAFGTDSLVLTEPAASVATTYLFDIELSAPADADVTVDYSLSDAVAGITIADTGELTIASGETSGSLVVSIEPSVFDGMTDVTTSIVIDDVTSASDEVSLDAVVANVTRSITIDNTP